MVSGIRKTVVALVLMLLLGPALVEAQNVHFFQCGDCHRGGFTMTDLKDGTLCMSCHDPGAPATTLNDSSSASPNGRFVIGDASNAMGSNAAPAKEISHMWGAYEVNPAAGAQLPTVNRAAFDGRYGISRGTVACSRCHNPHGDNADTTILKLDNATDQMCTDCHLPWSVANADALETHPAGIDYAPFEADTARFKAAADIPTAPGDVRLVGGKVSCTSCHNVHFADSDSSTADGVGVLPGAATGDGNILRSDGPLVTGPQRNLADGTGQLRSNLCQACHTYQLHGKGAVGDHQIGCLECHGGHSYNGGTPNPFVLRADNPDVPTRPAGVNGANAAVTFGSYAAGANSRIQWADDVNGTATGYCEQCHGDVQDPAGIGALELEHLDTGLNPCDSCHKHNDPAAVHSFNVDASAATCGACHGFPPYLSGAGNRDSGGVDGGYAFNDVDSPPADWDYFNDSGYYKDEATSAHNTHAGNNNNPAYYFVGNSGIENCRPCHGDNAGSGAGGHREPGVVETFRDVPFNDIATANGNLVPAYNSALATCDNVYCHTNGTPRTGDASRDYTGVNTSPGWDNGKDVIFTQPNRCSFCHGDDATSMNAVNKNNSARHQDHLGAGPMGITFGCEACHNGTASSASALQAGATDGRVGGKHVNSVADVDYAGSGSDLYNALGVNGTGVNYDAATGTCSIYCHDVTDTGATMDWDTAAALNCDDCHGGLITDGSPVATGSHPKHVTDAAGPQLACADCHGATADAGTHTGHLDGLYTVTAGVCDTCHGWDAGETALVWGSAATSECVTCHTGTNTSSFSSYNAPDKSAALTTGHNYNSATPYSVSTNPAANSACLDCHDASAAGHFDGISLDDMRLRTDNGFPAVYNSTTANSFCDACHGNPPSHPTKAATATTTINTHQVKNCVACHDAHGDGSGNDNIFMVRGASALYNGVVAFYNTTGLDSYDEDDFGDGGVSEDNADDICATCHSSLNAIDHNNKQNSDNQAPGGHNLGADCFTCHNAHTDAVDAFGGGAGTACNDCHDNPPATGAHAVHAWVGDQSDAEDRTDCAWCHTGADSYTYSGTGDQPGLNHGDAAGRVTILFNSVGYNSVDGSCASACHASTAGDGAWNDANGVNCDACHYYDATPSAAENAVSYNAVSVTHDEHFNANKGCGECHDMVDPNYNTAGLPGPLAHINDFSYAGAADDGAAVSDKALADQDEAGFDEGGGVRDVVRTGMTYSDLNTCAGGIGLGCHASGTPDWDVAIPNDGTGCANCHTNTTDATVNPISGLHDNSSAPVTSGVSHDDNFLYNSGTLTADCTTCHTTSPSTAHMDGTLQASYNTVTIAAAVGFTDGATPTCTTGGLTGCHLEGTGWERKWATTAYNNDATRCANCHGDYASGWVTGVIHNETGNETRGSTHNNTGSLSYPCADCHVIGASTAAYTFTDGTADWADGGEISHHGDDLVQINNNTTGYIEDNPTAGRVGCATASCHTVVDANHDFLKSSAYNQAPAANLTLMAGDVPDVPCSGCHGGGTIGTNQNNYWPDSNNANAENTAGEHQVHIEKLALTVYSEQYNTTLLTDNGNGTADAKQKELCAYCHDNPGSDGDHGVAANLPAETNAFYEIWEAPRVSLDDGLYNSVADTCATVDCHDNKLTTDNVYGWYDGAGTACVMCHLDVTVEDTHTDHTGASATFGRSIGCDDCHQTAAENVAWGAPGTPPANNHINGAFTVTGSVAFTYNSVTQSCGTNDCHEDGLGGAPSVDPYAWGSTLADCTTCHADPPATGAHTPHMNSTAYVACVDCHSAASNAAHIDNAVTCNTVTVSAYNSVAGTCTNTCHVGDPSDWRDSVPTVSCTDCHSGTYIGGGTNMPQYNMHTVTPTVSGKVHTDTGLGTTCDTCHDSMPAPGGSHVDGIWNADSGINTDRGMFAGFTDGTPATCTTTCHSAGTNWTYKWSATAGNSDGTECANCHGDYTSGWNTGVGHAENATRGNSSTHNDTGTLSYACTACHVVGATTGNYPWTSGSNDWAATDGGATTLHGDGQVTINNNGTSHSRNESPVGTWESGCAGCHDGPSNDGVSDDTSPGNHDFQINLTGPSTPRWALLPAAGDAAASGGGCDGCHNSGTAGEFWPGHLGTYPSRGGKHLEHVSAIATAYFGTDNTTNRNNSCDFCHLDPGGASHSDDNAPTSAADVTNISHILTKAADSDEVVNGQGTAYVTCSTVDCHFNNAVTPHWYTDDIAPAAVTLSAAAGSDPRTIDVSWSAPGDDNNVANTTPYVYDMRFGLDSGTASDYNSTTNYVGGLPAAFKQGYNSVVIVEDLNPASTYFFSMRTRDTAGNWSATSNVVSASPTADAVAPDFGGPDKAKVGDTSQTVNLYWPAAEDHSMPITYDIWHVDEASLPINYNAVPTVAGVTDSQYQLTATDGLVNDTIYYFGVRACDGQSNCDKNTLNVSATPTATALVDQTYHTYVTNGSTTLVKDGAPGTQASSGLSTTEVVFAGAAQAYPVSYYVDTFAIYLDVGNSDATITAEIGYSTDGSNFFGSGVTKSISVAKRSDRIYQFKLVDVVGQDLQAGQGIAIALTDPTASVTALYGDTASRGDVTLAERIGNIAPTAPTNNGTSLTGAVVDIQWIASTDSADGLSDTVHYDLYGSDNNGTSYNSLIATDLTTTSYQWDTQAAGITSGNIAVRINAGDGYSHTATDITALGTADAIDYVAPGAISDLVAEKRPKSGTVWLTWSAPGDDGDNNGRASYYDIRYSTAAISNDTDFNNATPVTGEPSPGFGGDVQNYEVTGLTPGTNYYFAIKTVDENSNASTLSSAKTAGSDQQVGGPRCGMCHTTAPSVDESIGNHKLHGFTLNDCDKCHDDGTTPPSTYGLDHQDGVLKMGYGPGGAKQGIISGNRIYYTDDGLSTGTVLYDDPDGFGGFGDGTYNSVGDMIDDGTCISFGALGVGGCHGSAGTDPDGAGPLPTYPTPNWNAAATLDCAACHGNPSRTTDTFYSRDFDGTTDNGGIVPDQILGAPEVDNHGNIDNPADPTEANRKYVGQHEKHLNYSFRFSKGDSCNLCHAGKYADKNDVDGKHANGEIDIELDLNAAGANAVWTPGTATTAGTCSNMSPDSCHPSASTPSWDNAQTFECRQCHGMAGVTPGHVTDPTGSGFVDDGLGNCEWCHFGGHPRDDVGGTSLILANSSQVGIDYRSGGIHLRKSIGGRASAATEAELCWSCHDANGISEWGTDTGANNTSTAPPNASDYNYGSVDTSNWTTATWSSAEANFAYKTGAIQSTHSTNETGTSAVVYNAAALPNPRYEESADAVANIRCSNCHDVHNLNKAPGDTMTGQPYLRGSWIRNPYPEDGAPWNKTYAVAVADFTAVPRAGGNEMGGYQIDQNNGNPTAGLSLATSAGLCTLCHGTDVDSMDKTPSENLWLGANGHSNATLGGTAGNAANIFGDGIGGRPVPNAGAADGAPADTDVYNMALQTLIAQLGDATQEYGYGYRSDQNGTGKYSPLISSKSRGYDSYTWGATVDAGTTDVGYHAFTCSKCHNPHASRLPKLMITNCLDTSHNTWDENQGSLQTFWTSVEDSSEETANHNTAQNCHRYDRADNVGGWNTVTPW